MKRYSKMVALLLCFALCASMLAACSGGNDTPAAADVGASGGKVIKIGVFEPMTGENGGGGFQEVLGTAMPIKFSQRLRLAARPIPLNWWRPTTNPIRPRPPRLPRA